MKQPIWFCYSQYVCHLHLHTRILLKTWNGVVIDLRVKSHKIGVPMLCLGAFRILVTPLMQQGWGRLKTYGCVSCSAVAYHVVRMRKMCGRRGYKIWANIGQVMARVARVAPPALGKVTGLHRINLCTNSHNHHSCMGLVLCQACVPPSKKRSA